MDTKEFIDRSGKIHRKYDYSLTEFKSYKEKVQIICPEHGIFEQTPNNHLYGKKGCKFCANNHKYCTKEILNEFEKLHGNKYDYSLVDYDGMFKKVKIKCLEHGEFGQTPKNHLLGKGCPKCSGKNLTKTEILEELKVIHDNLYDYSKSEPKRAKDKIKIICKKHGIFEQSLDCHKRGRGCPNCKKSKGETLIRKFLIDNCIKFESQKKFNDCKSINHLLFDFYLPNYNVCIEYDGEQHFNADKFYGGKKGLLEIQKRDNIKNNYCRTNNIKLIRISFREFKNINEILTKKLILIKQV